VFALPLNQMMFIVKYFQLHKIQKSINKKYLDEGKSNSRRFDLSSHVFAQCANELVRHNKDKHIGVLGRIHNVRDGDLREKSHDVHFKK